MIHWHDDKKKQQQQQTNTISFKYNLILQTIAY